MSRSLPVPNAPSSLQPAGLAALLLLLLASIPTLYETPLSKLKESSRSTESDVKKSNKVFIVADFYCSDPILGVYSSRKKAEELKAKYEWSPHIEIQEFVVDSQEY